MIDAVASDEALAKAAEDTGVPLPSESAPNAQQFEQWVASGLAPLLGLNLCLLGCLCLGRLSHSATHAGVASLVLGLIAVGAVYRRATARSYSDYLAVGLIACILASAFLLPQLTAIVALLTTAGLFALVFAERAHGRAFVLLSAWLPAVLAQAQVPSAAALSTLLLGPSAVLLLRRRFLGAAFVVIAVLLVQTGLELARDDHGRLLVIVLAAIALTLAILYELAVPIRDFSTFRLLLGQAPVIGALLVLTWATLPKELPVRYVVWTFAAAISCYQLLRTYWEQAAVPTRLAWVGLALALAAVAEVDQVSLAAIACQIVAIAGGLHVAGVLLSASVLADSGVLLLACDLAALLLAKSPLNLALVIAAASSGVALIVASERFPSAPALPWWSGFLRKRHATLLAEIVSKVFKRVADLAVVKLFFGWFSLALVWIRFAWQAAGASDIRPLVNLAGHVWLALYVARSLVDWIGQQLPNRESSFEAIFSAIVCNLYGTLLFARGLQSERRFTRLAGLGIAVTPAVLRALSAKSIPVNELAWLLLTTGSALGVIGLVAKQRTHQSFPQ